MLKIDVAYFFPWLVKWPKSIDCDASKYSFYALQIIQAYTFDRSQVALLDFNNMVCRHSAWLFCITSWYLFSIETWVIQCLKY